MSTQEKQNTKSATLDQIGKRTDIFRVSREYIVIPERNTNARHYPGERFNVRNDFGNIDALADQIFAAGAIRIPLLGHQENGQFHVTDGERRIRAIDILAERGHPEFGLNIPVKPEPRGYTERQRTLDMLFCATGKPLEMIERAEVFRRLRDEQGLIIAEIATEGGMTQQHVYDCLALIDAPEPVREAVSSGQISATLASTVVKESETPEIAAAAIMEGIALASSLGKGKATEAHIQTHRSKAKKIAKDELKAAKTDLEKRNTQNRMNTEVKTQVDSVDKLRQIIEVVPHSHADFNKMDALEFIIDYLLGNKTLPDAIAFFKE